MTPRKHSNETPRPKRHIVMVRLSDAERADAVVAAHRAGLPLSTYIRERAAAAAVRENRRAA